MVRVTVVESAGGSRARGGRRALVRLVARRVVDEVTKGAVTELEAREAVAEAVTEVGAQEVVTVAVMELDVKAVLMELVVEARAEAAKETEREEKVETVVVAAVVVAMVEAKGKVPWAKVKRADEMVAALLVPVLREVVGMVVRMVEVGVKAVQVVK